MKTLLFIISLSLSISSSFAQKTTDPLFSESEIVLKTTTGDIKGTITIPNNIKTSPIVLIIAGSGPTDRNCNSPNSLQTNAYKMLSVAFAENGISTLRFDKRGIGESKSAITNESELKFETYINDVIDWVSLLKSDKRFSEIFLLGHSEGSLIGMIAVSDKTDLSGFISIAGVGKSADKLIQEQLTGKLPQSLIDETNSILDSLRNGKTVSNVNPNLMTLFRPSVQPYMISWMKYDPAIEIKKLQIPVLIIQGSTDLHVSVEEAETLYESKPDARLVIIDNMNHVLKESGSDTQENMATYSNPELPLKEELVEELVNFITINK